MVLGHNIHQGNRTQDIQIKEDITFDSILLNKNTLSGLKKSGFYKPSPIQLHGIPLGKCGFDLLLEAKSGTGKTAVFTVIALEKIDIASGLQVIILAPTREIAAQISDVIKQIGSDYKGLNVEVVMGGLPVQDDISKFTSKQVHIVVGSPGRLKQLIQNKHIDISAVRLFVLDECDKLVEKSFLADINAIFSILPKQKQVVMSSATYPEKCKSLINKYVHNAQHICPDSESVLLGITQLVTLVKQNNNIVKQTQHRFVELLKILSAREFKQCLIFCNYQARVGELHKLLTREKWPAKLLYGQQEQNDRLEALKTLQEYKCRILISTDLAARGIDASNVDLVINFEPPYDWQTYLHRIGRAGRYGSYGTAISILSEGNEVIKFKEVIQSMNISLNLRSLWTGDEFSNSALNNSSDPLDPSVVGTTNISQPKMAIPSEDIHNKLWDILTCESEKGTKLLQTFEELQKSFQKTSLSSIDKIESFSDLLTSFQQSNDIPHGEVNFPYVNVRKIYIKEPLPCFQLENNDITEKELNSYVNGNINNYDCSEIIKEQEDYKISDLTLKNSMNINKHNSKWSSKIEKPKTNTTSIHNNIIGCNGEDFSVNTNIDNNMHDYTKALLNAGLPTSFGKNKNKRPSGSVLSKRDIHKKEEILAADYLDVKSRREETNCFLKWQQEQKSVKESTSLVKNNHKFRNNTKLYGPLLNDNNRNIFRKNKNGNYDIWYNQLKIYMKHIEYVVYMDQMSTYR